MHIIFIIYGAREMIDYVLDDISHAKFFMKMWKEGEKDLFQPINGAVRYLPGGIVEFVFPKEYADKVMTAFRFKEPIPYDLNKSFFGIKPLDLLKKFLKIEEIPDFKEEKGFFLPDLPFSIIPLGVRYDGEYLETGGKYPGWTHEAI